MLLLRGKKPHHNRGVVSSFGREEWASSSLLWAHHKPWHRGKNSPNTCIKHGMKPREGQPPAQGTQHSKPLPESQYEKLLPTFTLSPEVLPQSPLDPDSSTHQDEETFIGKFLVLLDSGQHGQHQAAEDQQKSAIAAWRRGLAAGQTGQPRSLW